MPQEMGQVKLFDPRRDAPRRRRHEPHGGPLSPSSRFLRVAAALALLLWVLGATRGDASFHTDVPAGAWRALAVKNLPRGAVVRAQVRTSRPLEVALVRESDLAAYPAGAPPVFRGRVEDALRFEVIVPEKGHYAVVLDNRSGAEPSTVDLRVEAESPGAGSSEPPSGGRSTDT